MILTSLTRLRIVGLLEGVSFLMLLGVAMPLKYYADYPMAVTVVGGAHGVLFILFGLATLDAWIKVPWWSILWTLAAFVASVLPFGTFVLDGAVRRREMRAAAEKAP